LNNGIDSRSYSKAKHQFFVEEKNPQTKEQKQSKLRIDRLILKIGNRPKTEKESYNII